MEEQWCRFSRDLSRFNSQTGFGFSLPGIWRGKSNFSPVRAALFQKLLGPNWYTQIYDDPNTLWLTPETFGRWKLNNLVRETIKNNLNFWFRKKHLSFLQWMKLLQTAYDFDLLDLFQMIWKSVIAHPWSSDELALLYSIY